MGPHLPATAGPDSSPRLRRAGPRLPCDLQTELLFLLPSRCLCLFNQAPGSEGADTERCLPIQGPETRRRGVHGERPSSAPLQPQSPTRVRATPPGARTRRPAAGSPLLQRRAARAARSPGKAILKDECSWCLALEVSFLSKNCKLNSPNTTIRKTKTSLWIKRLPSNICLDA